jgi:hypothetical protein
MATVIPIVAKNEEAQGVDEVLTVIDLDEFEEDRRDAEWQAFLLEARKRRAKLRLEDRIR